MIIKDVEVLELRVPRHRETDLDGTDHACVIRISTDTGVTGFAEVDSIPSVIRAIVDAPRRTACQSGLKGLLIGADPRNIDELWQRLFDGTRHYGRHGAVVHAISGIDIALWDLAGKIAGLPIANLLGGRQHDRLPAYITIYPENQTEHGICEALDRQLTATPTTAVKLAVDQPWRAAPEALGRVLSTVRRQIGGRIDLMLDATGIFGAPDEIAPLRPAIENNQVQWLEAPFSVDNPRAYAALTDWATPIAGGDTGLTAPTEWELILDKGRINIAQPEISWVGGFTGLLKLQAMVRERGRRLIPHGWNTGLTLASNLQFLAAQEAIVRWTQSFGQPEGENKL